MTVLAAVYKYMNLYQHQSKIALSANLQDAYQQIETIEEV